MEDADTVARMSVTSLNTIRKCPQQWAYAHVRGLRRIEDTPAIPLEFGTWWHALRAADSIHRGTSLDSLRHVPRTLTLHDDLPDLRVPKAATARANMHAHVLERAAEWWELRPPETKELWLDYLRQPLAERLEHADRLWRRRWERETSQEAPLAVEMRFTARIRDTMVPGAIDELVQDDSRGLVVVRDHKAVKDTHGSSSADDMMEPQLHIYVWGASKVVRRWGLNINAISYDRTRSVGPQTPKLTAMGNLAKTPSDFDADTYREWAAGPLGTGVEWGEPGTFYVSGAKKGQPKFGMYEPDQSVIDLLSSPVETAKWNDRTLVPLNPNLIRTHLRSFVGSAEQAAVYEAEFKRDGEVHRNLGRNCSWCDFKDLCRAQMIGGPDGDYPLEQYGLKEGRR